MQGYGLGPASYVVTASDLHPVTPGKSAVKIADDTYLVIPTANVQSCAAEIAHIENWAAENNLSLYRSKSAKIVFVSPWSKRAVIIPPPSVPGFVRAESIKVLGVTISRRFSVTEHVDNLSKPCAQTLFAMRTLRHPGLPTNALNGIFRATVVAKLSHASPAWWDYANADDKARLEAFQRRSSKLGFRADTAPTI